MFKQTSAGEVRANSTSLHRMQNKKARQKLKVRIETLSIPKPTSMSALAAENCECIMNRGMAEDEGSVISVTVKANQNKSKKEQTKSSNTNVTR